MKNKPTIAELERMLNREEDVPIEILPNGTIRRVKKRGRKPPTILTLKENLGGEYGRN